MVKIDRQLGNKLFALAAIDANAVELRKKRADIEGRARALGEERDRRLRILAEVQSEYTEREKLRAQEENLLAAEEMTILDRRKQLQSIGGAKAAKIIEREIEIAARSLQTLEERVTKAMEEVDKSRSRLSMITDASKEIEEIIASEKDSNDSQLSEISERIADIKREREAVIREISKMDDRIITLYERIRTRYPMDPVASTKDGSCRSCFRALPNQLFNLILAGNTRIQCPGCSRILVLTKEHATSAH